VKPVVGNGPRIQPPEGNTVGRVIVFAVPAVLAGADPDDELDPDCAFDPVADLALCVALAFAVGAPVGVASGVALTGPTCTVVTFGRGSVAGAAEDGESEEILAATTAATAKTPTTSTA
jgi:hypothetical protein